MSETQHSTASVADAVRGNWVDRHAPDALKPYFRLARYDRPIGWWLLMWPCQWSTALAAIAAGSAIPDLRLLLLFWIGAVAMRGAGSTWNDILDRKIDAGVERTKNRPLPSGQIGVGAALGFLVFQALVGLAVLLQLGTFAIVVGLCSLGVVAVYPLMKRITSWPQAVLGLAFSWGALMGWATTFDSLAAAPILLYVGCIFWTIGYDTIYAHQDRRDDAIIGVKSTARLFDQNTRLIIGLFYAGSIFCWGAALYLAGGGIFGFGGLTLAALHLAWQVRTLDIQDRDRCLMLFRSNAKFGWLLFGAFAADAAAQALL
jgi:4-hydroxybenzoate polyprenyltransferase